MPGSFVGATQQFHCLFHVVSMCISLSWRRTRTILGQGSQRLSACKTIQLGLPEKVRALATPAANRAQAAFHHGFADRAGGAEAQVVRGPTAREIAPGLGLGGWWFGCVHRCGRSRGGASTGPRGPRSTTLGCQGALRGRDGGERDVPLGGEHVVAHRRLQMTEERVSRLLRERGLRCGDAALQGLASWGARRARVHEHRAESAPCHLIRLGMLREDHTHRLRYALSRRLKVAQQPDLLVQRRELRQAGN